MAGNDGAAAAAAAAGPSLAEPPLERLGHLLTLPVLSIPRH